MSRRFSGTLAFGFALTLIVLAISSATTGAVAPANSAFERTWARTDRPVIEGQVARTWMWGPEANTGAILESYVESPNGQRTVQYYDKSRMEIINPNADPNSLFYVTNGLLVVELMSGRLQLGDNTFEQRTPANINVAGDGNDPTGPTYLTFAALRGAPPLPDGATIIQRVDRNGNVSNDTSLAVHGVTAAHRVQVPGIDHQVASPFWAFMNSSGLVWIDGPSGARAYVTDDLFENPFYATGYPVTEAYWALVMVGGTPREVLMQCFERRCLTFTPGNPPGFITEAGNVGQHYHAWRYPPLATATSTSTDATATASETVTEEYSPTASSTYTATSTATATYTATATATEVPLPEHRVYVTDVAQHRVQVFSLEGDYLFSFGELGTGDGQFTNPGGVAVDQNNGWVYVADRSNNRIQRFDLDGAFLGEWGSFGTGDGQFDTPTAVTVDPAGWVYVTDQGNNRVQKFNATGGFAIKWGAPGAGDGQFNGPLGIAVSAANVAFVVDSNNHRVQAFNATTGVYLRQWGEFGTDATDYQFPTDIALDNPNGDVFVTDTLSHHILHTDAFGNFVYQFGLFGDGEFAFNMPSGIAIDQNYVIEGQRLYNITYIVDQGNDRVVIYASDFGVPLGEFGESGTGPGQFTVPSYVAVYHPFAP